MGAGGGGGLGGSGGGLSGHGGLGLGKSNMKSKKSVPVLNTMGTF